MRFGSVCSGIEAASVAWNPLGWRAVWFSEIEPFPSAVLAHRYPDVPNLGDMSTLPERIRSGEVEAPDVFCGGTPCQAFSVAGLRRSLDDARGNLSLTFCEIANAIDAVRARQCRPPAIIFWENVPGVLSTHDNAFGCFLAGLAGEDDPLVPSGKKWSNAGAVYGPKRAIAWRVLDAQYFGVAQRRRRVFVVASARTGFDPAAVLFEFDGVRRDIAPSREAGEGTAARAARSVALRGREGGATAELGDELAVTGQITHALNTANNGKGSSEDGTGRGVPTIATAMQVRRLTPRECERLQGFPDDYTRIPWKLGYWPADKHSPEVRTAIAEQCPDGPRYKALGNSWAVPNVRWIGRRIADFLDAEISALI